MSQGEDFTEMRRGSLGALAPEEEAPLSLI
jgi:hypothetical protein